MFEALKFWKKKPVPVATAEPVLSDVLERIFAARAAELRAAASESDSPTLTSKLRGRADEVEFLRERLAQELGE